MDIHIPLASREDTASLCSNLTLWEMDDIEPSEPLSPAIPDISTRTLMRKSVAFTARDFALPHQRPANNAGAQHEPDHANPQWPFGPPQAWADQSKSTPSDRNRTAYQALDEDLCMPNRDLQQQKSAFNEKYPGAPAMLAAQRGPPSEMSFLELHPKGDATISYQKSDGEPQSISGIAISAIEESCPLLALAFEPRSSGPRLHLEILTEATANPFLRYLYTGSYAINGESGDVYEDVPTSLLLHCQLYHLGDIYDLPELKQQASVNIIRQCEFGCSSPDKPIDLVTAIEYVYKHLAGHAGVLDTIISYCVSCFLRHCLKDDKAFKQIAFELKPFHQALCRESMNREFEDETASAIIQMPFKRDSPDFYLSREDVLPSRIRDVVHHFHGGGDCNNEDHCARREHKEPPMHTATRIMHSEKPSTFATQLLSALKIVEKRDENCNLGPEQTTARSDAEEVSKTSISTRSLGRDEHSIRVQPPHRQLPYRIGESRYGERSHATSRAQRMRSVDDGPDEVVSTELTSDSDYEFVPGPASVESLSSENDSDTNVPDISSSTTLAGVPQVRRRNVIGSRNSSERSSSFGSATGSSDSEWSLV